MPGSGDGSRRRYALYSVVSSRVSTPDDQPSVTMWCNVMSNQCYRGLETEQMRANERPAREVERHFGNRLRSPLRFARAFMRKRDREIVLRQALISSCGAITCTGSPSCIPKRVRSTSCRRATSFKRALQSGFDRARPTSAARAGCCRPSPVESGGRAATGAAVRRTAVPRARSSRMRSISFVHRLVPSVRDGAAHRICNALPRIAGRVPCAKATPDEVRAATNAL